MGWSCSWVAVKDAPKDQLLASLDLVETGREVDPGSRAAPLSCATLPDGWVVLFSEAFDWADAERVLALSRFGLTVGCQFEDKVEMTSIACACRDGVELWRVSHANDPNHRLDVTGDPPAQFAEIRDRLLRDQEEDGGEESDVDYLHDVPLDLARSVCGYRADEDRSVFVGLRPAGTSPQPSPKPAPGMVGKLLAMFGRR